MFFQTHLGIEMALCAEVWLIGPDIEAWPDRTRFFWCLSNQHCALTYPTLFHRIATVFCQAVCYIHLHLFHLSDHSWLCRWWSNGISIYPCWPSVGTLHTFTRKLSQNQPQKCWLKVWPAFWMNTSQTKSWRGHIEPRQDPLQLKLWRGGGGGLVQPVDSQDSNARPSVSLLIQFPIEIHLSAFKMTPCTCME